MTNEIPTKSRLLLKARDAGHCVRCGGLGNDWHHRRRRGVRDEHTHTACNGLTLCLVCHAWCHSNPTLARAMGWIVGADENPHDIAAHSFLYGWVLLNHDGTFTLVGECVECERVTFTEAGMCMSCLRANVCCGNAESAAAALCGCGGGAAVALRRLIERVETRP